MPYAFNPTTGKLDYYQKSGAAANGLPVGGTAGQVLAKIDETNYNAEWIDPAAGGSDAAVYHKKEIASATTAYSGTNATTNDESDASWKVIKMVQSDNNNAIRTIYTAVGAWANRATLSYTTKLSYEV